MYSANLSWLKKGSSQACRMATLLLPRATSMNRAIADSRASAMLVTRAGKPSARSCA